MTQNDLEKINAVFLLFKSNYPFFLHGLSESQEKAMFMTWISKLKEFTKSKVDHAANKSLDLYTARAPTIGQFMEIIKPPYQPAHQHLYRALPPPQNKSVAKNHIDQMRAALGQSAKYNDNSK